MGNVLLNSIHEPNRDYGCPFIIYLWMYLCSPILRGVELATIQKQKQYVLSPVDSEILQAVWFHHFMTAEQILRHRNRSSNGITNMQEKVKVLYDLKYLDRFYQPRYSPHASLPFVYLLAS